MVSINNEFRISALYLNAKSTKLFYLSAWRHVHPYLLLGTRIFILVYSIIFMSLAIYAYDGSRMWLLHITTWNYILAALYFALVISIAARELIKERRRTSTYSVISISPRGDDVTTATTSLGQSVPVILLEGKEILFNYDSDELLSDDDDDFIDIDDDELMLGYQLPPFHRFTYCIFNISSNLSIVIAIAYWTILHDYDVPIFLNLTSYLKIDATLILLFWMLIELALNDIPIRLMHFVFPVVMTIIYFMVHTVYALSTGHVIYETVDWLKSPLQSSLVIFLLILGVILTHVIMFFLNKIKKQLSEKLNKMRKESILHAER